MHLWLLNVGEVLPTDKSRQRLLRAGVLAESLRARGHQVTWWTSTFNHVEKKHRFDRHTSLISESGIRLELLHGPSYARNISLRRLWNHFALASAFKKLSTAEVRPDVILCSWPTIEMSAAAVEYGTRHNVPVIVDVRDLWPDIFLDVAPPSLRPALRLGLQPYMRMAEHAFRGCSGVVGVSERYRDWGVRVAHRPHGPNDRVFPIGYKKQNFTLGEARAARAWLRSKGVDPSKFIACFVGTFGSTYDLAPVFQAARDLQLAGDTGVQFVICGDGDRRREYSDAAAGLRNVVFTGWANAVQIAELMKLSKAGLAAYRSGAPQGLPNKIFEYISESLPILSSLRGECEEFLDRHDCGLQYAPSGDGRQLVQHLQTLRSNDAVRTRLSANAARAFKTFSADRVYAEMADYLERFTHRGAA